MLATLKTVTGNLLVGILLIGIVELVYSLFAWWLFAPTDIWIYEHAGQTVRFDAIRGYALAPTPSRFARITRDEVEYVGTLVGNAQGLPDRDNFTADRPDGVNRRYAVFGDSFTAAQYIDKNWPDATEDLTAGAGERIQLLNFSIHAGGLANWARLVAGLLAREDYVLDGMLFAVYGDDLDRTFTFADGRNRKHMAFGRVSGWDPANYPDTYARAADLLDAQEIKATHILSSTAFDAALTGDWQPPRDWEFKVYTALRFQLRRLWRAVAPLLYPHFSTGQLRLIDNINVYTAARALPVLVVYLPGQAEASGKNSHALSQARWFAEQLGAGFYDGRDCFAQLEPERLRALWFKHDEHWNQAGSDRFAACMARRLSTWPVAG